jgi:hypothetical protein
VLSSLYPVSVEYLPARYPPSRPSSAPAPSRWQPAERLKLLAENRDPGESRIACLQQRPDSDANQSTRLPDLLSGLRVDLLEPASPFATAILQPVLGDLMADVGRHRRARSDGSRHGGPRKRPPGGVAAEGLLRGPRGGVGRADRSGRTRLRAQIRLRAMTGMTRFVLAWYSAKLGMTSAWAA